MNTIGFSLEENEYFYGGATHAGRKMPLGRDSEFSVDLAKEGYGNQSAPFFLSTKGRYLWSDAPFSVTFSHGEVHAEGEKEVLLVKAGDTLADAYRDACRTHFPPTGEVPEETFYLSPQYNTWVELLYDQNQESVLSYAKNMLAAGFRPGILMIDDTWQEDYGVWRFHPGRFHDPKAMIGELHALGFRVMLWIVPYLSPDSPEFREAEADPERLLRDTEGKPILLRWWNGYSACLDLRRPKDAAWLDRTLGTLMREYGVDGFKFDGGSVDDYAACGHLPTRPTNLTAAWFAYAAKYRFNETKDTYDAASLPLNQRLRDKAHAWDGTDGLNVLIPDAINASLIGTKFLCPDMVGGGEWTAFLPGVPLDEELIVRSAECAALFPMMQFSVAPYRILSDENLAAVRFAADLHAAMGKRIFELVRASAKSGDPVMTPLAFRDPDGGFERTTDAFFLGEDIVVYPVLEKGARTRTLTLPKGKWRFTDGTVYAGRETITVPAPLGHLPFFERVAE